MKSKNREDFIESIYVSAIADGDPEFNSLIDRLDELLPDDEKVLRYQLLEAVIRFTIEKANELNILVT